MDVLLSSVFLIVLQIFSPEVTLICDQVLINVGAYNLRSTINLYGFKCL